MYRLRLWGNLELEQVEVSKETPEFVTLVPRGNSRERREKKRSADWYNYYDSIAELKDEETKKIDHHINTLKNQIGELQQKKEKIKSF